MSERKGSKTEKRAPTARSGDVAVGRVVTTGFNARVYDVVQRVPTGTVATYGDVATLLGSPRVARHV
ncbi:MAG: O6-methylguanine-DNA--protein-cysteine methyltransferase, partial [Myxococcota bacterium]